MHCENSIVIRAPLDEIFRITSDLESWPRVLPHYRWIRRINGDTVQMAARRGWLPIRWTSRFEADAGAKELRFYHLKAFTRGMNVKWTYTPTGEGVRVRISHELNRWYAGLLARYFIAPVASRTLATFKQHLEAA